MNDLLTLGDIAEMNRCSMRHARDVLLKLPGFPDEAPTSTPRNRLWLRSEVRAFKPFVKDAIAAEKRKADEAFLARCAEIENRSAANRRHHRGKRRAAMLQRTPSWANLKAIEDIYKEAIQLEEMTGLRHHVDHVIPLQGRLVSGLHVETNLRAVPWSENVSKGNRFEVEV